MTNPVFLSGERGGNQLTNINEKSHNEIFRSFVFNKKQMT